MKIWNQLNEIKYKSEIQVKLAIMILKVCYIDFNFVHELTK